MSAHECLPNNNLIQLLVNSEVEIYEGNSYEDTNPDVTRIKYEFVEGPKFVVFIKNMNVSTYLDDELVDVMKILDNHVGFFLKGLSVVSFLIRLFVFTKEFDDGTFFIFDSLNLKKLDFVPFWVNVSCQS